MVLKGQKYFRGGRSQKRAFEQATKDEKLNNAFILFPLKLLFFSGKCSEVTAFNAVIEIFLFFYLKKNDFCVNVCTAKKNEVSYHEVLKHHICNDIFINSILSNFILCLLKRHIQQKSPNYITDSLKDGLDKRTPIMFLIQYV